MGLLVRYVVASSLLVGCAASPSPRVATLPPLIAISAPPPIVLDPPLPPPAVTDETRSRAAERARRQVDRARPPDPYVLTPRIRQLEVSVGTSTTVACAIEVRVSSIGADGDERWDVGRTATAVGRALVTSSGSASVEGSVDACVDSAAREAVRRRVGPFLERSVAAR